MKRPFVESSGDELDRLEKDVRHRLNFVKGLLKLRGDIAVDSYKSHFEQVKVQFDEIEQHIAEVRSKIDRELAMLHQVQAVIQGSEKQKAVVKELHNKLQSAETLKVISDLRSRTAGINQRTTTKSSDTVANREIPTRLRNNGSKPLVPSKIVERRNNVTKDGARNIGIYSRDRDTFNRYIL